MADAMQLLPWDALPATPWKNGGGVTRELAAFPPGAGFGDFAWRVSVADVAASGPFSRFPGVDRVIMLVEGDGMQLVFENGMRHALMVPMEPFRFRGEDGVDARLAGGPSRDFNLMLRRGHAEGELRIFRDNAVAAPDDGFVLFHCAAGAWRIGEHLLAAGDTLVGAPEAMLAMLPVQADAILVGVRITAPTTRSLDEETR